MDLRRPGRVDASLNELEALARKAARGAGLPWGLAEDAGWAVRWLEARELPAATLLAHWLDRRPRSTPVPQRDKGIWTGGNAPLCPLVTGPMLAEIGRAHV